MGTANKIIWNALKKELNQALNMLVKENNSSERDPYQCPLSQSTI